jgi:hypothetical protein
MYTMGVVTLKPCMSRKCAAGKSYYDIPYQHVRVEKKYIAFENGFCRLKVPLSVHRTLRMRPSNAEGEAAANKAWIKLYHKDPCGRSKKARLNEGERTVSRDGQVSLRKATFRVGHVNTSLLISDLSNLTRYII